MAGGPRDGIPPIGHLRTITRFRDRSAFAEPDISRDVQSTADTKGGNRMSADLVRIKIRNFPQANLGRRLLLVTLK